MKLNPVKYPYRNLSENKKNIFFYNKIYIFESLTFFVLNPCFTEFDIQETGAVDKKKTYV
jgi:hypothetical protein